MFKNRSNKVVEIKNAQNPMDLIPVLPDKDYYNRLFREGKQTVFEDFLAKTKPDDLCRNTLSGYLKNEYSMIVCAMEEDRIRTLATVNSIIEKQREECVRLEQELDTVRETRRKVQDLIKEVNNH